MIKSCFDMIINFKDKLLFKIFFYLVWFVNNKMVLGEFNM